MVNSMTISMETSKILCTTPTTSQLNDKCNVKTNDNDRDNDNGSDQENWSQFSDQYQDNNNDNDNPANGSSDHGDIPACPEGGPHLPLSTLSRPGSLTKLGNTKKERKSERNN